MVISINFISEDFTNICWINMVMIIYEYFWKNTNMIKLFVKMALSKKQTGNKVGFHESIAK